MASRPNVSLADELCVGEYGTEFALDTAAHPAPTGFVFYRIDVISAAVFTTLTSATDAPQTGNAVSTTSFPVLFSLYGKFTTFTLASGKVAAYYKPIL
jgi:hypothetical protein